MKMLIVIICLAQIFLFCGGQEICSGRDISNERRFQIQEIQGLWYQHFIEDNTFFNSITPTDVKLYFMTFDNNAIKYYYGRNQSGPGCTELIFLNRQREQGSNCVLDQLLSPEVGESLDFIYSLLPGNDQLLMAFCQNPPSCTIRVAVVVTRRKNLCPGERELFLRKFRELRIPVFLKNQQNPTANDCTFPGLENIEDKRSRSCRQVTRDASHQLHGRGQGRGHRRGSRQNRY